MPPAPTERLRFRSWTPDDFALAWALWGDPRVAAHITAGGAFDEAAVRARLADEIELERAHGVQYWPVFLRADDEHAGCCGLRPHDAEEDGVYEIGVHLRPALWGRGLAREAMRAAIDHAFDDLGAPWLFAGHNPRNEASRRMLERLGFRYTHDELYRPTGRMHPSYRLERDPRS